MTAITEEELIRRQEELREKLCLEPAISPEELRLVAGVDSVYWEKDGTEYGVCCIVVLDYHTREVVERQYAVGRVEVPYMPGFLAFREVPLFLNAYEKLTTAPDLFVFDGNGILHPRRMGFASHAGIAIGKPSIGVAKNYYRVPGAEYAEPGEEEGAFTDIVVDGEVRGRVLRTHAGVKPVFVSPGHRMDPDTATAVCLALVGEESHVPIPTRLADIMTHEVRRECQELDGFTE